MAAIMSGPARGLWIEIAGNMSIGDLHVVGPRKGPVD